MKVKDVGLLVFVIGVLTVMHLAFLGGQSRRDAVERALAYGCGWITATDMERRNKPAVRVESADCRKYRIEAIGVGLHSLSDGDTEKKGL